MILSRLNGLEMAAEQGDANAQYSLGNKYHWGHGVPKDYTESAKWTRMAAKQGDANPKYSLRVYVLLWLWSTQGHQNCLYVA